MRGDVLDFARRGWHAALSRGVGYEPQPEGTAYAVDGVRGYFVDFRAKTRAPTAATPDVLGPAGLAQLALGWWERHLTAEPGALEQFVETCSLLERRGAPAKDGLRFAYDVPVPKYGLAPGWCSALAQGQVASVFVRLATISGDERHAEVARAAAASLLDTRSELVAVTPAGPILEEAPTSSPSCILNGWIYALWGLHDLDTGLDDRTASDAYDAGIECLLRVLERYDAGWWSRYSLYPHRLPDLAKPFYHRLHIDQLGVLHRLTGEAAFARMSERWRKFDNPVGRSRALAQKAVFAAAGRDVR